LLFAVSRCAIRFHLFLAFQAYSRLAFIDGEDLDLKRQCSDNENPFCNLRPEGFADDYEGGKIAFVPFFFVFRFLRSFLSFLTPIICAPISLAGFFSGLGNGDIVHFKIAPQTGELSVHKVSG
jgi:hypothetical protein